MIIASIDIGTNTVLLLIAEINPGEKIKTILNEYRIPRIGKGLLAGHPIEKNAQEILVKVLKEYEEIIKKNTCEKVLVTATNAFRIASNSREISQLILKQFGWEVNIVLGEDEAYLSYLGAVSDIQSNDDILVIDIGGGSTELISGKKDIINYRKSFQAGVVSGSEKFLKSDPPTDIQLHRFEKYLDHTFEELLSLNYAPTETIALAGTPTTLACMSLNIGKYDENLIEGLVLKYAEISKIKRNISSLSNLEILKNYSSVVKGREDLILAGSIILLKTMKLLKIDDIKVSTRGIRYGAILKEIMNKN